MPDNDSDKYSPAWYEGTRQQFLATPTDAISNQLAGRAADESLEIEPAQRDEWRRSVELLQKSLDERLPILRKALMVPGCELVRHVILEFDFRRRGLRMDCVLLAEGVLFVIEFKAAFRQLAALAAVLLGARGRTLIVRSGADANGAMRSAGFSHIDAAVVSADAEWETAELARNVGSRK